MHGAVLEGNVVTTWKHANDFLICLADCSDLFDIGIFLANLPDCLPHIV